ncbi:MAG TPA: hypothetical protein VJT83_03465 [Chitinophagaceae bacterium]|nr:hypothetical protein [Chitinophagaceae bacterium]
MKRISVVRILIVGTIITTTMFVVAANTRASIKGNPAEECTEQKACEDGNQSEFILESLTKGILGR